MPRRKDVWKTPLGQEIEEKLIRGEIKGIDAAAILGISPAAVSIHMRRLKLRKEKFIAEMEREEKPKTDYKETFFNEVELLKKNIEKLLEMMGKLEKRSFLSPSWYNMYLRNMRELRETCETLLRLKGEMPEISVAIQVTQYKQHINILNNFIFERHPELIDEYEQFLREKLAELGGTEQSY